MDDARADLIALGREQLGLRGTDDDIENVLVALRRKGALIIDTDENGKAFMAVATGDTEIGGGGE